MFVLGNFLAALARVLDIVLSLYMWVIVIRALASWLSPDPYNPVYQFLIRITEPVLGPVRRILPFRAGMVDLSPIVVILVIVFIRYFAVRTLFEAAHRLG